MHIKNLKISNMGYMKSTVLRFASNNINVIQGVNGSGKTTVLAMLYSVFQDEETLQYKSIKVKMPKSRFQLKTKERTTS